MYLPQGWTLDLVDVEGSIAKCESIIRRAHEAEQAKFDSIWLFDHFHTVPRPVLESVFECWTMLSALARETKRVRLGQMATCNGYRSPAMLAKMSSCVDVLSGGRLIVGIGAGWYRNEFEAFGYHYYDTPTRLRQLGESVQVLKAMWTQEHATFIGDYYEIRGAINEPKPVQQPHPPLWIAGGGEIVTLRLVARHADGCNIGGPVDVVRRKLDILRRHCESANRDYDAIVKSTNATVFAGSRNEVQRLLALRARQTGQSLQSVRSQYVGSYYEVAEQLRTVLDMGVNCIIFQIPNLTEDGAVGKLAEELIPLLR